MKKPQRVLIVSHGHPVISKGGAEVAAHNLFKEYKRRGMEVVFLGRSGEPSHGGSVFSSLHSDHEVLFHTWMSDFFLFQSGDKRHVWHHFRAFLKSVAPDVVHFHHYLHMGIEMIREVRNTLPDARIVFTLHEYLAICANNGQMVKRDTNQLCYQSSPFECSQCFPERSSADFFLRQRYIQSFFQLVDRFISPSRFLKQRYVDWGIDEDRIEVIENGQPAADKLPPRSLGEDELRNRFAFFGQINMYKGIDVLLEAVASLPEEVQEQIHLDLYGTNLDQQTDQFRTRIGQLLEDLEQVVTLHGAYETHELERLMQDVDWVIVPSIWWENSPMVIQEAFLHGRPIICSNIGGMAEKVRDGVDGLHFRARSHVSLARQMRRAIEEEGLWEGLYQQIPRPLDIGQCADLHLALYRDGELQLATG